MQKIPLSKCFVNAEVEEAALRALTASSRFAHQQWPDAYLAAFARASGLTLVTFDKALGKLAGKECVLLA